MKKMKHSIKKHISIIIIFCSVIAVSFTAILVNLTITKTFDSYLENVKDKRNSRIVGYFQQIYRRDGKWDSHSGEEMMHEAYMSDYCLSLLDENGKVVWEMDPNDIKHKEHIQNIKAEKREGIYNTETFNININEKTVGYVIIGDYSPLLLSAEDMNFKFQVNKSILFSGTITIVIVIIISLILSKQFSRPIKAVSNTSVNLSKGNYDSKLNIESDIEEIENLVVSINSLGNTLKNQDSLRKQLISDISHEIRTPLNILQNNLEAMIDGIIPITNEKLVNLNDEVIRFGRLLNNLNSLKAIESEDIVLNISNINIHELISIVISDFLLHAHEKKIEVILNKEGSDFDVLGDFDKLKQVFINIISNSIKFTNENGKIYILIKSDADHVIIKIMDNGIGIKEEDMPFIFERMYRGDKSRNKTKGNGLGLSIVKTILNLHSASIDVKSNENEGTVFKIRLNKKLV